MVGDHMGILTVVYVFFFCSPLTTTLLLYEAVGSSDMSEVGMYVSTLAVLNVLSISFFFTCLA